MRIRWISLITLFSFALGGCGPLPQNLSPLDPQQAPTKVLPSTPLSEMPTPGDNTQMTPSTPGLQGIIDAAKEDLSKKLSIPVDQVTLVEATAVVWPDSSMGCPQPGMEYLQVPTDGALIILQAEEILYEYHRGGRLGLFLCEKNFKSPEPPAKIDLTSPTPPAPDNSIPPQNP